MAMPEWVKKELRSNYARASRAGRWAAKMEPRAVTATYRAGDNSLLIELTNGAAITIPVKLIRSEASRAQRGTLGRSARPRRRTPLGKSRPRPQRAGTGVVGFCRA